MAEYNHDESGEPNVVDMTEDDIGMDSSRHEGDVNETGQQKYFDNTAQINPGQAENAQSSIASMGIIGTKDLKNREQIEVPEFTPGKNLKDCIARSLLEESQKSFNITSNQ